MEVSLEEQVHINFVRRKPRGPWVFQANIERLPIQTHSTNPEPLSNANETATPPQDSDNASPSVVATVVDTQSQLKEKSVASDEFNQKTREILDNIITSFKAMLEAKPEWYKKSEVAYILEQAEAQGSKEKPIDLCLLSASLIQIVQSPSQYQVRTIDRSPEKERPEWNFAGQELLEEVDPIKQAQLVAHMLAAQRNIFEMQKSTLSKAYASLKYG